MQVFEFHFNPKGKGDLIFNSFCFEPENIYEKRLGGLYLAGALKNALPQNLHLLEHLTQSIKQQYYKNSLKSPAKALQEGLKLGNGFLENLSKKGDVSWLGNLSFAALSLKNFELNFTKTGEIKIYLLRRAQTIDIDKRLKFEELEPYPLKIFGNIVSGKLAQDDIILILTEELLTPFQDLLIEIATLSPLDDKKLKEIFRKKEESLSKISGLCLLISLSKAALPRKKEMILGSRQPKEFAFKNIFNPVLKKLKKLIKKLLFKLPSFKINKNIIFISLFILFLVAGFFISQKEEKGKLKTYREALNQIQEKANLAESWDDILNLKRISATAPQDFKEQVLRLEKKISDELFKLNKLTEIPDPELIFETNPREFIPQKIISDNNSLYLFSPYASDILKINGAEESALLSIDKKINSAAASDNLLLFFSRPGQIIILKDGQFNPINLQVLPDYVYNDFSAYQSNLYFFDEKNGQIIKYLYQGNSSWSSPRSWLISSTKKAVAAKSMTVAGSAWILDKNNSISRYYAGQLQETLKPNIFPSAKDFSKILALPNLFYIYLLEPQQKRLVIINRTGEVIRQFRSDKFNNLLDFSVSEDGKTIYLLNGLKIYKILF